MAVFATIATAAAATLVIRRLLACPPGLESRSALHAEIGRLRADLATLEDALAGALRGDGALAGQELTALQRSDALRRAGRGESAPVIAQAVGAPLADIEFLLEFLRAPTASPAAAAPGDPRRA